MTVLIHIPKFKTERHRRFQGLIECLCWKLFSDCGGLQAKTFWGIVLAKAIAVASFPIWQQPTKQALQLACLLHKKK